jgi:hypothetical protein
MTPSDYEKALLALVMYREARGDGMEAMRAVGHVVANRVAAKWGDWSKVITKHDQFSSMSVLGDSQNIVWINPITQPLLDAAEAVYGGNDPDVTLGAMYYANERTEDSEWYKTNIINSPNHPVTVIIGKQTFRR